MEPNLCTVPEVEPSNLMHTNLYASDTIQEHTPHEYPGTTSGNRIHQKSPLLSVPPPLRAGGVRSLIEAHMAREQKETIRFASSR
jgi:hypothetical protein